MLPLATSAVDALLNSPATDLARLLALPVFGWAAYRDVATRRVPNETWLPLAALGVLLLAVDGWRAVQGDSLAGRRFFVFVAVSLGLVAPLGYVFWRIGGFGGADAKAVMVLALLFPTYPVYYLPAAALPLVRPYVAVFSLTVLSNTVVIGAAYPLALAGRNLLRGRVGLPMFVGKPVAVDDLPSAHGRLLEDADGFTRSGLDVDALRMYLRWRGLTLAEVRADPDRYRDPASLPPADERNDPGDGAVADGMDVGAVPDGADVATVGGGGPGDDPATAGAPARSDATDAAPDDPDESDEPGEPGDPWGAAEFLATIDGSAYGTTPDALREGLEVVTSRETVWLTPGVPFIVPMFLGLVVGLTYGDLLFALMRAAGLVP